jgi:DNA-binding XRE family transcriptional regulator
MAPPRSETNYLIRYRVNALLSQRGLARASGVSERTIVAIETQGRTSHPLTKAKLARALGVEAKDIWPGLTEIPATDPGTPRA